MYFIRIFTFEGTKGQLSYFPFLLLETLNNQKSQWNSHEMLPLS